MTESITTVSGSTQLRKRMDAGESISAIWLLLGSPAVAECMAYCRPDVTVFDLQHGLWTRDSLEAAVGVVSQYSIPLARTKSANPDHVETALEAGAAGIIVPFVEDAQTARAAIAATRYSPAGRRSAGGVRPLLDFETYVAEQRASPPFVAMMIETVAGLEAVADIAAVDGVDLIFVGSGDLSLSLGTFPEEDERHTAAVRAIITAAGAAGRPTGVFTLSERTGALWRARGAQMTVLACDNQVLLSATEEARSAFNASRTSKLAV